MKMSFTQWLGHCDTLVQGRICVSLHDLEDVNWRDYYNDQLSPGDAIEQAYDDRWGDEVPSQLWNKGVENVD